MDTDGKSSTSAKEEEQSASEAFNRLVMHLGELERYVTYLLNTKMDRVKLSVRQVAIGTILGFLGVMITGSIIGTSVVLLLTGLAESLAIVFDGQLWLGNLIVGGLALLVLGLGITGLIINWQRRARNRTMQRYAQRQQQQQTQFGHSVTDQAAATAHE